MRTSPRGYVLMIVIVMGVVLASLAGTLLYAVSRDRSEAKQQTSSVRAVYASEAAVAVGIEKLRSALEENVSPNLTDVETAAKTAAVAALPGASLPTLSVRYFDAATNSASATPFGVTALTAITSGKNTGLMAQQTPIQVFAVAQVDKAMASVADAIRVDLIPVFQFAMFFDGDFELQNPAGFTLSGRIHTNGDFYVSGGSNNEHHIKGVVTIAGRLNGRSSYSSSVKVSDVDILKSDGTELNISNLFPFSTASAQKTEIEKWGGTVSDSSTGAQPLTIPLRLTSSASCVSDSSCGAGSSCVRVRASDARGVCTENVVSRPSQCGTGEAADFRQSLAVELIRRPASDYASVGVLAPYKNIVRESSGAPVTSPYSSDFGPKPAIPGSSTLSAFNDYMRANVSRSIPRMLSAVEDDDPGARLDRMYWKADVRIIDGVWYRKGSLVPIFDPEVDAYADTATVDPTDLKHKFARVQRYSWWWDPRESRNYCSSSIASKENCVLTGGTFQRGAQIRSSDFDMAAFMALLEDSAARAKMFPAGLPPDGPIVYVSETYDPTFEDSQSKLPRAANVRNFLNFPVMHNHLTDAASITTAYAAAGIVRRSPARNEAVASNPPSPYEVGWIPENLWGRRAPTNFESLTRPATASDYRVLTSFGTAAMAVALKNSSTCGLPTTSGFASSADRRPSTRPSTFGSPAMTAPCVRAAATPLGPENAVRFIRGTSLPSGGFTFVTDNRLYVQGDVNVRADSTVVSAGFATLQDIPGSVSFIADSVTILSSRFSEMQAQGNFNGFHRAPSAYNALARAEWSGVAGGRPPYDGGGNGEAGVAFCSLVDSPYETRINASFLMGDVPACVDKGNNLGNRGGGVNNFPRFVEDWDDLPLLINGSMVSLFRSERGNSRFLASAHNGGFTAGRTSAYPDTIGPCIYTPPERRWMFDNTLLTSVNNLPPGTPRVVATDRLRWVRR